MRLLLAVVAICCCCFAQLNDQQRAALVRVHAAIGCSPVTGPLAACGDLAKQIETCAQKPLEGPLGASVSCSNGFVTAVQLRWQGNATNGVTGSIATQIGLLSELRYVGFYRQNIRGTIPEELFSCQHLVSVDLDFNPALSGTISTRIGLLSKLESLHWNDLSLLGTVPSQIGRLTRLQRIRLAGNAGLVGDFAESIGNLSCVTELTAPPTFKARPPKMPCPTALAAQLAIPLAQRTVVVSTTTSGTPTTTLTATALTLPTTSGTAASATTTSEDVAATSERSSGGVAPATSPISIPLVAGVTVGAVFCVVALGVLLWTIRAKRRGSADQGMFQSAPEESAQPGLGHAQVRSVSTIHDTYKEVPLMPRYASLSVSPVDTSASSSSFTLPAAYQTGDVDA
jgi:hypothetical protein